MKEYRNTECYIKWCSKVKIINLILSITQESEQLFLHLWVYQMLFNQTF